MRVLAERCRERVDELRQQMTALVQTVDELETIEREARERIAKAGPDRF
ncbi:hypothetical protein GCM10020258_00570 [Sphingomonas yabuuchiae]